MHSFIIQQIDGMPDGSNMSSANHYSQGYVGSTAINYEQGRDIRYPKSNDDKLVIGYTHQGLPFQMVVSGVDGGETQQVFKFIDLFVTPLMTVYAEKLSVTDNTEQTLKELIHKIYQLRQDKARYAEFTMALAIYL